MIRRLRRIGLNVGALRPACNFYQHLGFTVRDYGYTPDWAMLAGGPVLAARLALGEQEIELARFDPPGEPYKPASTAADLWFQHFAMIVADISSAVANCPANPITTHGPVQLPPSTGNVIAYKFRDDEGHPLEFLQLPDPTPTPRIDHSAIAVADAGRSIRFYHALGLATGARQINRGPTQAALDGLAGVEVEIVALHPPARSPHVELLCYRAPPGRPASPRADDIADTRLEFDVADLAASLAALGPAGISASTDGRAALLRDPDGHAILLRETAA